MLKDWKVWAIGLGVCIGGGVGAAYYLDVNSSRDGLAGWGRFYLSVLHLQLAADLLVLVFLSHAAVLAQGGSGGPGGVSGGAAPADVLGPGRVRLLTDAAFRRSCRTSRSAKT